MTLIIQKPTTSKLILAQTYVGIDDPDAAVYIAAVEAADEAASPGVGELETATKVAIHSFVKGCKNDGIWPAIKASCILAGARTLAGALVPLVGAAPTNVGPFVSGDYNRKTGLVGDGSTKHLNSNRAGNTDPRNSFHISIFIGTAATSGGGLFPVYIGNSGAASRNIYREQNNGSVTYSINGNNVTASGSSVNFAGATRTSASSVTGRFGGTSTTSSVTSSVPLGDSIGIFGAPGANLSVTRSNARLAFYSIGESLDLALLDARVTALINAIGAAIP
jgi:hypothetical protein